MNKSVYISLLLLLSGFASGNAMRLSITIGDERNSSLQSKAQLFAHYVNQKKLVDSVSANNTIIFQLDNNLPKGLYSLMLYTDLIDLNGKYQRIGFDVIITGSDIEFTVDISETLNFGNVQAKAGDNFAYYNHFNTGILTGQKIKVLEEGLAQYPKQDEFYEQIKKQLEKVKHQQENFNETMPDANKYPLACYYLQAQKIAESKTAATDFSNPLLKNSAFVPMIVWNYLDETESQSNSVTPKSGVIIDRLAIILPLLKEDKEVFELMFAELSQYYEKTGLNDAVIYLNEQYLLPDVCENVELVNKIKRKNQTLKKILIGQQAPEILLSGLGNVKSLIDIKSEYTLLVFWETSCPHCQQLTKELSQFYLQNKSKGFEILAVSLDTSKTNYASYTAITNFEWLSFADFNGWESNAAKDYNVVATPSMFLLDREKKIVAKPLSLSELKAAVL